MLIQDAKDIFFEATELPLSERDDFVRGRCAGDDQLAERVRALLAAHEDAGIFMEEPTAGVLIEASKPADDEIPERIGCYTIERMLGEGGYGAVYLAHQDEPVRRDVALKVIKPGMDSRQVIQRFEVERRTLAMMDHPSIARVLDAGTTDAGRPYFVMERVDGEPITSYCDRTRRSLTERLLLFEQVCRAVQHAHQKGVIHRDLKPTNVLVAEVDGKPIPKVIDFGIAKALTPDRHDHTAITETLQVIGTPQYMSPEQATAAADVDTRSDVYSLSVLLYELVAGAPPFEGERLRSASFAELERIIREENPPRPSSRCASLGLDRTRVARTRRSEYDKLVRDIRGELDWIIMRGMEKDPSRRYPTAYAFGADVGRFLRNEPVEAGPPSRAYRMVKFAERHRIALAAAAMIMIVFTGLLVGSIVFGVKADRSRRQTESQLVRADALTEFAQSIITGVDPAVARTEDTALLRRLLDDAAARVSDELDDQPDAAVSMLIAIGYAYRQIAEYDLAMDVFAEAARRGRTEIGEEHTLTLDALANVAAVHVARNEFDDAERMLYPLIRIRTRVLGPDDPITLETRGNLAYLYNATGRHEQAYTEWEDVLERRRRTLGDAHEDTVATMNSLASATSELGDEERALELLREVLERQLESEGPEHPHTLATMNNIADSELSLGRHEEAGEMLERVIAVKRTVLPENHPSIVISLNNLAHARMRMKNYESARDIMTEAVAAALASVGEPHMITLTARVTLASAEHKLGNHDTAEALLRQSLADIQTISEGHPREAVIHSALARLYIDMNRLDDAVVHSQTAETIAVSAFPENSSPRLGVDITRAEVLIAVGEYDQAEARLLDIHFQCRETLGPDHPRTFEAVKSLVKLYDATSRLDDAAAWRATLPEDQRSDL